MINNINWNNEGIGSTSIQRDIGYFGYSIRMKPVEFLALADKASFYKSADSLKTLMENGEEIAPCFLNVDWINNCWKVIGHEGRNRAYAASQLFPTNNIPIHIIPIGLRRRDVTEEMMNSKIISQDGSETKFTFKPRIDL